jgi:serine/threonine-protein kinase HipA
MGPAQHERKLRLAMKVGGDYRIYPNHNPWPRAARELGLDSTTLADRVRELAEFVPDTFADAIATPEVKALDRPLPARLLDLVADRAQRCRQLLAGTD